MPREGRTLELLVKHLQEHLAPEGVEVRSPEEFHDSRGNKIGEIDVTLRGNFGSTRVLVGIECRDRPSDGPQGSPWIREISGKKQELKVDKMVAASTTGFTQQAIDAAETLSIDLIAVENLESIASPDWFRTMIIGWRTESFEVIGPVDIRTIPSTLTAADGDRVRLRIEETELSLQEYIGRIGQQELLTLPDSIGHTEVQRTVVIDDLLDAVLDDTPVQISRIRVHLRLIRDRVEAKALLNACRSVTDGEIGGLTGMCRTRINDQPVKVLVSAKKTRLDPTSMDLRFTVLTEDDKEYWLPAGTTVSLYGSNPL